MEVLTSKERKERAILIGRSENDKKTLRFLFDNHVCWGFYLLWEAPAEIKFGKADDEGLIKALAKKYPDAQAFGVFHSSQGFVPPYEKDSQPPPERNEEQEKLFDFL